MKDEAKGREAKKKNVHHSTFFKELFIVEGWQNIYLVFKIFNILKEHLLVSV